MLDWNVHLRLSMRGVLHKLLWSKGGCALIMQTAGGKCARSEYSKQSRARLGDSVRRLHSAPLGCSSYFLLSWACGSESTAVRRLFSSTASRRLTDCRIQPPCPSPVRRRTVSCVLVLMNTA